MELNWRDRVKLITVTPRPGYASGFGLKVTGASLSVDDHGTTKSASLDKVAKAYDDISWTTQPSAARPPSGPSAGAQRPPTPTNVTSAGRANSETFKLIQVLAPGDSDGSLYPAVSDGSLPILMDSWDQTRTIVKGVSLTLSRYANREKKGFAAFSKRDVTLLVTDARVAVVCVDWNKGQGSGTSFGHFAGSQVNVALANKARKLKEAHDRVGRILAGHARYGWISDVGYQPAYQRFLPQIHICIPGSEGDTLVLGVTLTAKVDSAALAQTIAQRTAAYRLKYSLPANDTRSRLARLAAGPPPLASPEPGKLATYSIPGYVSPSVDTALPA